MYPYLLHSTIDELLKIAKELDPKELEMGRKVEREHSGTIKWIKEYYKKHNEFPPDEEVFEKISLEHLDEFRNYYTKLKAMENS
jgi:hypothetical protein